MQLVNRYTTIILLSIVVLIMLAVMPALRRKYEALYCHRETNVRRIVCTEPYMSEDEGCDEGIYTAATGKIVQRYGSVLSNTYAINAHTHEGIVTNNDESAMLIEQASLRFDSLYTPSRRDIKSVNSALLDDLSRGVSNATGRRQYCRYRYLRDNLTNWVPQYAGFCIGSNTGIVGCVHTRGSRCVIFYFAYLIAPKTITILEYNDAL